MLGPILMGAEMLERTFPLDERNRERVYRIIAAAKHGRDIVRNVLAYCRKETKTLGPVDLVAAFHQFVGLAESTLPPTIRVVAAADADRAVVTGEASQIEQILLNLANNARDAMDGHGTLTLALALLAPGKATILHPFATLDPSLPHAEIRVTDTGCGNAAGDRRPRSSTLLHHQAGGPGNRPRPQRGQGHHHGHGRSRSRSTAPPAWAAPSTSSSRCPPRPPLPALGNGISLDPHTTIGKLHEPNPDRRRHAPDAGLAGGRADAPPAMTSPPPTTAPWRWR